MKKIIVFLMCTMCVVSSFSKQCVNVPEGERFDYDFLTFTVSMPNVVPFRITNTDSTITFWAFKCELDEPFDTTQRMNNVKQMDWHKKIKNKMQWDMDHYFKVATFKSFEEYQNFIYSLSAYMEANFDDYENAPAYKLDANVECYPAYNYRWISFAVHPLYLYAVFVDKSNPNYFGQILRLDLDALAKKLKQGKWKDMQKK